LLILYPRIQEKDSVFKKELNEPGFDKNYSNLQLEEDILSKKDLIY